MATRGWQDVTQADITRRALKQALQPKGSKYLNVKTVHDGIVFDSKREADRYVDLRVRLKAGEIRDLQCQVPFTLWAPILSSSCEPARVAIAEYVADFVYDEHDHGYGGITWTRVVEDAKGKRTAMYQLKKKWLELQQGLVIREV